jgi:hypothetical protein
MAATKQHPPHHDRPPMRKEDGPRPATRAELEAQGSPPECRTPAVLPLEVRRVLWSQLWDRLLAPPPAPDAFPAEDADSSGESSAEEGVA